MERTKKLSRNNTALHCGDNSRNCNGIVLETFVGAVNQTECEYARKMLSQQHKAKSLAVFSHVRGTFGEKFVARGGEEIFNYRLARRNNWANFHVSAYTSDVMKP